jgi:DNA-directed RNA polymerase III subunit RPC7
MHTSPYFLSNKSAKEHSNLHIRTYKGYTHLLEIDRYSDKYVSHLQAHDRRGKIHAIVTDLSFFPEELHTVYNAEKAQKMAKSQVVKQVSFTDTLAKLKDLEGDDGDEEEEGAEVEEGEDEVVYEEEELEDETDYNVNYFDNGEEYGDYDDGDEGPIY